MGWAGLGWDLGWGWRWGWDSWDEGGWVVVMQAERVDLYLNGHDHALELIVRPEA